MLHLSKIIIIIILEYPFKGNGVSYFLREVGCSASSITENVQAEDFAIIIRLLMINPEDILSLKLFREFFFSLCCFHTSITHFPPLPLSLSGIQLSAMQNLIDFALQINKPNFLCAANCHILIRLLPFC